MLTLVVVMVMWVRVRVLFFIEMRRVGMRVRMMLHSFLIESIKTIMTGR